MSSELTGVICQNAWHRGPLGTRTIVVPMGNHDNDEHGYNENLRLQNLWDRIDGGAPDDAISASGNRNPNHLPGAGENAEY
ncbi:MAG: hypothetical protein ABI833_18550 [Acidobacteriota bacterium]